MIPAYSIKGRTSCRRGQIDCYSRDAMLRERYWSTTAPDTQRRLARNGTWQGYELVRYVEDFEGIVYVPLSERYFPSKIPLECQWHGVHSTDRASQRFVLLE